MRPSVPFLRGLLWGVLVGFYLGMLFYYLVLRDATGTGKLLWIGGIVLIPLLLGGVALGRWSKERQRRTADGDGSNSSNAQES